MDMKQIEKQSRAATGSNAESHKNSH